MVESRYYDPFRGVQANWPREILKTGTLEMRFPAIWSSNFCCSSYNFVRNCIVGERGGIPPCFPQLRGPYLFTVSVPLTHFTLFSI